MACWFGGVVWCGCLLLILLGFVVCICNCYVWFIKFNKLNCWFCLLMLVVLCCGVLLWGCWFCSGLLGYCLVCLSCLGVWLRLFDFGICVANSVVCFLDSWVFGWFLCLVLWFIVDCLLVLFDFGGFYIYVGLKLFGYWPAVVFCLGWWWFLLSGMVFVL